MSWIDRERFGIGEPSRKEGYDTNLVCLNGHIINSSYNDYPQHNSNFCPQCGAKGITACPKCNSFIRGHLRGVMTLYPDPPAAYCYNCGSPYPWTDEALKAVNELIDMSALAENEKNDFKQSVAELTKDTPKAKVACEKFKKYSVKVGKALGDGIKEIVTNVAAEAIKKALFPDIK
jgi:hypothetical protein